MYTTNCTLCNENVPYGNMFKHLEEFCEFNNHDIKEFSGICETIIQKHSKSLSRYDRDCLFTKSLKRFMDPFQIVKLLTLMSEICDECYNNPAGCRCWDDE